MSRPSRIAKKTEREASNLFQADPDHSGCLSATAKARIDDVVTSWAGSFGASPLILEGYSADGPAADQMPIARSRALTMGDYNRRQYRLDGQAIVLEPRGSQPPAGIGRNQWDGISVVLLSRTRR